MASEEREIPDQQVREAADQFDDARLLLAAQPPGARVLLPLLNNACVAVELYLKSLGALSIRTADPALPDLAVVTAEAEAKNHKLVGALDAIPQDIREQLESEFESTHGLALRDVLTGYEGLFAISRYPFEKAKRMRLDDYGLGPLMKLCVFLRQFVGRMEPVTRVRGERGGRTRG